MLSVVGILVDKTGKARLHAVPNGTVALRDGRGLPTRIEAPMLQLGIPIESDTMSGASYVSAGDIVENDSTVLRLFVEVGAAPILRDADAVLPPNSIFREIAEDLLRVRAGGITPGTTLGGTHHG